MALEIPEIFILASLLAAVPATLQVAGVATGVPTVGGVQGQVILITFTV